jgi:hypothetical protein
MQRPCYKRLMFFETRTNALIGAASIALFESLSREDDDSRPRLSLALRLRNGRQG